MRIVVELKRGENRPGGPEQPVQAHADAEHLRRHHARPRRRSSRGSWA
ncbi:MAG: hypothetical protein MZV70_59210 [Desulfobacterales bacterium]|nr:hypothetical protein [Desulfobacterales bacterium]